MARPEKNYGEHCNDDIIRDIMRKYASRDEPIGEKAIIKHAQDKGYHMTRGVVPRFANRMGAITYVTEDECDEIIKECRADEREIVFIKTSREGRVLGYWMMETISESEWMFLMDSVLNSKILTKKEADNLAKRITFLAGKQFSDFTRYRYRMRNQPYFIGDADIDENVGHIESRVLKQVHLIRQAINRRKKLRFNLCIYDYVNQQVRLVPYGKHGKVLPETPEKYRENVHRICSPFEVVFSNGRYYMLGADLETERNKDLKYKLYRVDLMTDMSITRATAITKEEAGIQELNDLYKYRIENPYMFTGKVKRVRIRVDADQFTQIVDWFSDNFEVVGFDADESKYYDIEVRVNTESFIFWLLQYSGCVQVLGTEGATTGKRNEHSLRDRMIDVLENILKRYKEG